MKRSKKLKKVVIQKLSEKLKTVPFQHICELPDCVISHIFSKLSMKDLVKTSALSKRWLNEWASRMDLNFDLHNMFDSDTIQEFNSFFNSRDGSPESSPFFKGVQSEFARRVDQFMLHYKGAKIRSLRVDFPLGDEHNDIITRLISQGIAKGAERIELLFSNTIVTDLLWGTKPYKFSWTLLSGSDSLKFLHLQNCLLVPPIDFSECPQLEGLTFMGCTFVSDIKIISPALRQLSIIDCVHKRHLPCKIYIDTLNLSSFEYRGHMRISSIKAPRLLKFYWDATWNEEIPRPFDLVAGLHQLENLAMVMSHSQVARLPWVLGPFQYLRKLELFISAAPRQHFLWISDIIMACPHLQKLSLTIKLSHLGAYQGQGREHVGFFHNELKYVELHGCTGYFNELELIVRIVKIANSLKQITFNPSGRFYIGAGRWTRSFDNFNWFRRGHNLAHMLLKDKVNEQCQLVIL